MSFSSSEFQTCKTCTFVNNTCVIFLCSCSLALILFNSDVLVFSLSTFVTACGGRHFMDTYRSVFVLFFPLAPNGWHFGGRRVESRKLARLILNWVQSCLACISCVGSLSFWSVFTEIEMERERFFRFKRDDNSHTSTHTHTKNES